MYLVMTVLWALFPGTYPPATRSEDCWDKWAVRGQLCGDLSGRRPPSQQVCLHMVAWTCDQGDK